MFKGNHPEVLFIIKHLQCSPCLVNLKVYIFNKKRLHCRYFPTSLAKVFRKNILEKSYENLSVVMNMCFMYGVIYYRYHLTIFATKFSHRCLTKQKQPPEVFCKKGVLRNFAKFTGKHLCQSLFFDKVAGLRPATLLKKRLWHRCFPVNFAEFLWTPFFTEHLWTTAFDKIYYKIKAIMGQAYNRQEIGNNI